VFQQNAFQANAFQEGYVALSPDVTIALVGLLLTFSQSAFIVSNSTAGWLPVIDAASVLWALVDDSNTATWAPVSDTATVTWTAVDDSEASGWTPVDDSETVTWS
jgi:hypothetical protein